MKIWVVLATALTAFLAGLFFGLTLDYYVGSDNAGITLQETGCGIELWGHPGFFCDSY